MSNPESNTPESNTPESNSPESTQPDSNATDLDDPVQADTRSTHADTQPGRSGGTSWRRVVVWWNRMRVMTAKEFLQLYRDRILIVFMIYAFTLEVYLAGAGVSMQLQDAGMRVHDSDHSFASRELIHRFRPPQFRIDGEVFNEAESVELLDRGEAMMVLDIPPQFQETLLSGNTTSLQMQIDTSNPVLGFLASSYGQQIVGQYGLEVAMEREGININGLAAPIIHEEHRVWYNANQNDAWFMSLVEMLNVITMFAILLPASAMAREKERGTVEQLLVSPLSTFQMMFPKVLAMTSVILVGTLLTIHLILQPFFGVPFRGSLTLFMAVTAIYVFTTAGIGMLLATIARNLAQVGMLTALIFIPMVFLSGAWTPPENMPPFLRAISSVAPLHHYIDASLGIMLKGSGISILWDSILAIALFGVVIYGLSMGYFRRQFG
ncbi:ABC-2 type transport system permease protein [Neorhodopirellula lusitana]|uniref:Transport permease protein n=1 Tax=Neorhodopirellula lusitana TaxID=445327 RepID=A0ABY1Q8Q6_9BACT|nr:ABC transporter permease [Neorhodopirellula lusitana]SMP61603.1 ABC-2 type transport system permease protein [Neorhodopirellula lusitana]